MTKLAKVIVTIIAVVLFIILSAVNQIMREESGFSTPGFVGLILLVALIGALRAIWKKKKDNNSNDGTSILIQ